MMKRIPTKQVHPTTLHEYWCGIWEDGEPTEVIVGANGEELSGWASYNTVIGYLAWLIDVAQHSGAKVPFHDQVEEYTIGTVTPTGREGQHWVRSLMYHKGGLWEFRYQTIEQDLIASAAEATEHFSEDELESHADKLRKGGLL